MNESVFVQIDFLVLVVFSMLLPTGIYFYLLKKLSISRNTVLLFGIALIFISGIDFFLLQRLSAMAKNSVPLLDDHFFSSELSVALYLLPALFAGIGINMISHILINHLADAEMKFDRARRSTAG